MPRETALPTGTVTFLFTDVEGSTRLLAELGDAYAETLAEHRRVLREAFDRHGGVEVDTQGDAFFVAFSSAAAAVAAAAGGQAALEHSGVRVRMGIHTGEPTLTEEGYVGLDVHRAARIAAAAHGGQVLLSDTTRGLAPGQVLRDLGRHRLKDLAEPVHLFQLGDEEFPPPRSLNATNLPAQPSPLIGRERELAELLALARNGARLVTLTGPGGTGKTRLALQAAAEMTDEFHDGVFWVPLASVRDSELVVSTAAQALGAKEGLADYVGEKRMLLLLDNLEQIVESAPALADVIARCPNLRLLATSRVPLRIAAEREYAVPPLPDDEAVTLFRERANVAEPEAAVREICRRLDGLPLAIELAAARTRVLAPDRLLARLDRALPLLIGGTRDAPERHRTLRATIEWSHDLLSSAEQELFRRLSVFAGGWTLESAEEVSGADLDTLESLVEKSLVRAEGERFTMLETVREYAFERLEAAGEHDSIHARLAEHVLTRFAAADITGQKGYSDQGNWRAAATWALARADAETAVDVVRAGVAWHLELAEIVHWSTRALIERTEAGMLARARLFARVASAEHLRGRLVEAADAAGSALALFREHGTATEVADALIVSGQIEQSLGGTQRAESMFRESLELANDNFGALHSLGELERDRGNLGVARDLLERALVVADRAGSRAAHVVHGLGDLALEQSDPASARSAYADALRRASAWKGWYTVAHCLGGLAAAAAAEGRVEDAGRLWGAAEEYQERHDVRLGDVERARYERRLDRLDRDALKRLEEEGRSLEEEDALMLALEGDA